MKSLSTHLCAAAVAAAIALPLLLPEGAAACTFKPPSFYGIVADPSDTAPPSTPQVTETRVYRAMRNSSCGDHATVSFAVTATDDKTPAGEMGYLLEVVGDHPGLWVESKPVDATDGSVSASFQDDGSEQDFEIDIWSVDRAGNLSERAKRVSIHVEEDTGGCAVRSASPSRLGSPLLLLLLGWHLRRSRRR